MPAGLTTKKYNILVTYFSLDFHSAWPQTVQAALTTYISWNIFCSTPYSTYNIKVSVVYLLVLELFGDKTHFFKFLYMSDKPLGPAKNYCCYSYIVQAPLNCSIHTRKGKYPVLKINMKFHQLIKHAKICYSIASLLFFKFRVWTTEMAYTEVPQSWGIPGTSKSTSRVS